jgi:hypothetical protein
MSLWGGHSPTAFDLFSVSAHQAGSHSPANTAALRPVFSGTFL